MAEEMRGSWKKLSSRVAHENPYYRVREDGVIRPQGDQGKYYVVEGLDASYAIALDGEDQVYLVKLHRYTNNNVSIEVPAGATDGEDPLDAAKRELKEETGLEAQHWESVGKSHPCNGILQATNYVFVATGLRQTEENRQAEEGISAVVKVPFTEVIQMIRRGEINDTESISALIQAALHLGKLY